MRRRTVAFGCESGGSRLRKHTDGFPTWNRGERSGRGSVGAIHGRWDGGAASFSPAERQGFTATITSNSPCSSRECREPGGRIPELLCPLRVDREYRRSHARRTRSSHDRPRDYHWSRYRQSSDRDRSGRRRIALDQAGVIGGVELATMRQKSGTERFESPRHARLPRLVARVRSRCSLTCLLRRGSTKDSLCSSFELSFVVRGSDSDRHNL